MLLPPPAPGPDAAVDWVREHLGDLCCDTPAASPAFRGGQQAADAALATLDLTGYAARRNEVLPRARRGANATALRAAPARPARPWDEPWPEAMNCVSSCREELETDGWLVNQTRMWLSSQ